MQNFFDSIINKTITYEEFHNYCMKNIHIQPHCFWSGLEGKKKAIIQKEYLSDDKVPFIKMLFQWLTEMRLKQNNHDPYMTQISYWVSRVFASTSIGIAKIFISQDKSTENPGYTVGTNLWEAELPELWNLLHKGIIDDIHVHLFNSNTWDKYYSLKEDKNINFPIWRRNFHSMDDIQMKESFVEQHFQQKDYDNWRLQPPRNSITLLQLKRIIYKWKMYTIKMKQSKNIV